MFTTSLNGLCGLQARFTVSNQSYVTFFRKVVINNDAAIIRAGRICGVVTPLTLIEMAPLNDPAPVGATSVDSYNNESVNSNEAAAAVPSN